MVLLIDLDGTLTDTAHPSFKGMKDGLEQTDLKKIPLFEGAKDFIESQKQKGNLPIIISDSHTNYVSEIANKLFSVGFLALTDKPNTDKIQQYIYNNENLRKAFENKDNFIFIGDSWLDIELGRRLNVRTVLTSFYKIEMIDERDGIGQDWKPIKMGPTYYANSYKELSSIIDNPISSLLALESVFQGSSSSRAVNFKYIKYGNCFTAFRCLARQNDGECDRFASADKYYQIDNPNRSIEFLKSLSEGVENYLKSVLSFDKYKWDYFSYVSDKETTKPQNKMKEIFDLVTVDIKKTKIFEWGTGIEGSLRNRPNYQSRREFISKNITTCTNIEIENKNIIVLDDQFTSSATAYEITNQLRSKGAGNILFISLFYLILPVESKACPICSKPLKIKIRKSDGNKFFSCVPPKYRGEGCGYTENIN